MTQLMAFIKKEWMELLRTGKFMIIVILFMIFGVMNPAIAKLTPWMMEMYSEELKILDRNTVKYMVDQMQEQIDNQKEKIAAQEKEIQMLKRKLEEQK